MNEILPTHTCFDDTLDFLALVMHQQIPELAENALEKLRIVHAVCLAPEGPSKDEPFAHGWVEVDDRVWQGGIWQGHRVWFSVNKAEYYAEMRVQRSTRYTAEQALALNWATNHYGPWEEEYRALCGSSKELFR